MSTTTTRLSAAIATILLTLCVSLAAFAPANAYADEIDLQAAGHGAVRVEDTYKNWVSDLYSYLHYDVTIQGSWIHQRLLMSRHHSGEHLVSPAQPNCKLGCDWHRHTVSLPVHHVLKPSLPDSNAPQRPVKYNRAFCVCKHLHFTE